MTPTVLRVNTRTVGKLYLEDVPFCSSNSRIGARDYEHWSLETCRWLPVRDGGIDIKKNVRSVIVRTTVAHHCIDLGKVINAIRTVSAPAYCYREDDAIAFFAEVKGIQRRERVPDRITIVYWTVSTATRSPCGCSADVRVLVQSLVFHQAIPGAEPRTRPDSGR